MTKIFEQGEEIIFQATFYSDRNRTNPVDPTNVVLKIQKPNGSIATPVINLDGARPANVGKYITTITVSEYGDYDWRWETGNPLFIKQGTIQVNQNLVV